jgi:hypothetical protein
MGDHGSASRRVELSPAEPRGRLKVGRPLLSSLPSKNRGVPHISLVFREMWDATNLNLFVPTLQRGTWRAVVSHMSRKTSEIWGTPRFVEG